MTHRTLPAPEILYQHDSFVGEGPVWDPRIGAVVWVDIPNSTVFTTDPATGETVARDLGRAVGVVLPRASGGYVAALRAAQLGLDVVAIDCLPGDIHEQAGDAHVGNVWRIGVLEREQRLRHVSQGPDGAIYVSDDYAGAIYRVSYGENRGFSAPPTPAGCGTRTPCPSP